jgi:hypothetical protein
VVLRYSYVRLTGLLCSYKNDLLTTILIEPSSFVGLILKFLLYRIIEIHSDTNWYAHTIWNILFYCSSCYYCDVFRVSSDNLTRLRVSATSNWSRGCLDGYALFGQRLPTVITLKIISIRTCNTSSWYIFFRDDATTLVHHSSLMTAVCLKLLILGADNFYWVPYWPLLLAASFTDCS